MSENGLEVKVTVEDFAKKSTDDKLITLYQVGLHQQKHCNELSGIFDTRIEKLETDKKISKAKILGFSIGSGIGGGGIVAWVNKMFGGN